MQNAQDVVLVEGLRTPFAKAGTAFKNTHPVELGRSVLKELLYRTELEPSAIDEVIVGNISGPSDSVNISRVVAMRAGVPQSVPAYTVHRNCASALQSIASAYDKIAGGSASVVVAGGVESMSASPIMYSDEFVRRLEILGRARTPLKQIKALLGWLGAGFKQVVEMATTSPMRPGRFKPRLSLVEGLTDPFEGINMGQTAEQLARDFNITRQEQDEFALNSHQKAVAAREALGREVVPFFTPPNYEAVSADVGPREGQSLEQLQKLKPFFDRRYGTVTVGNSCPITDGAGMVLMMSRARASELGYTPLARIRGYAFAGCEPRRMGLGPVYSTPRALKRAGVQFKDLDLIELNEAFAAQVLACARAFESDEFAKNKLNLPERVCESFDFDKLNTKGGAIALGHPVGATGTRLVLTLMHELKRRDKQLGLATLCIGGGQGGAMVLERVV